MMKLYGITAKTNRHEELEVILPGFSHRTTAKKIQKMLAAQKFYIRTEQQRTNQHTGAVEIIQGKELITGVLEDAKIVEYHHQAFHNRFWDERKDEFTRKCPRPYYNGRTLSNQLKADHDASIVNQPWNDATADWSSKAKGPETKLKARLKTFEGDKEIYARVYRRRWALLTKHFQNKPVVVGKKTRKKVAIAS